jgi:hypothetical protein
MSDEKEQSGAYVSPAQIGLSDADVVKRWVLELSLAAKEERDWLKNGERIYERYRGTKAKKNSFNILWSNTETLRQAVYNTLPKPDVRRRFRDADPVAKEVSTVIERCAGYAIDVYDFDHVLKLDLLDMLLPGRGVSRVKYVPDIEEVHAPNSQETEAKEDGEAQGEVAPAPQAMERIAYEMAVCEHVQYDDFRHGPGKTWDEVRWIAFRHRFSHTAGIEKFGDVFKSVPLDDAAGEEIKKCGEQVSDLFKTAEAWEIWDKDDKEVLFIAPAYKAAPLSRDGDPLGLDGFFPIPRPLYAIEDATSLIPVPLYELYKQQAEELDRVSSRINSLVDALKVRGVFNSVMKEIERIQDLGDNQLLAASNVAALVESGGLEKHIWMMPIEQAANVINVLVQQREACKAVIYEITGIADIMRGATDSQETLGAQKIKTQWGTQRLKKMQAEFQRYVRDIIRLKCQIIANRFQLQTIKDMTGLQLLGTEAEKQQIQAQAQAFQQFQQAQQGQQQPPMPGMMAPPQPDPAKVALAGKPSWEQVYGLLRDNVHRNYRIDIETDSTIAASMESDLNGLQQVLTGLTNFITGAAPAVQSGSLPIDAVKEIAMTITRRARMGMAVEDALDKMQEPQPQADPKATAEEAKAKAAMQLEEMRAGLEERASQREMAIEERRLQMQAQFEERQAQNEMRIAQAEQSYQAQQDDQAQRLEQMREEQRQAYEERLATMQAAMDERMEAMRMRFENAMNMRDNATKIEVAEINAGAKLEAADKAAERQPVMPEVQQ